MHVFVITDNTMQHTPSLSEIQSLVGEIAHEFNNVLMVIIGNIEMLGREQLTPDMVEMLGCMRDAAFSGSALTDRMQIFSGRSYPSLKIVRLVDLCARVEEMLGFLDDVGITLRVVNEAEDACIAVDPRLFDRAIYDIASNAFHAMPDGGSIMVRARRLPGSQCGLEGGVGCVALDFVDSGCGMDESVRARACQPFFTTRRSAHSLGLGLSVIYGVVQQCGGRIEIDSAPGLGTAISMFLPDATDQRDDALVPKSNRTAAHPGKRRVLVVEDDAMTRAQARRFFQRMGCCVTEAERADAAIAAVRAASTPYDLLFTDIRLPSGDNGLQLAQDIGVLSPATAVLFTSGHIGNNLIGLISRRGRVNFIAKPYTFDELVDHVTLALSPDLAQ